MTQPNDDFDSLKTLLRCKQYEQPPPGYFNTFSGKVAARIEAQDMFGYSSFWEWLVAQFNAKPFLVCAYGVAVSGLLLAGFRLAQIFENEAAGLPTMGGWLAATPPSTSLLPLRNASSAIPASFPTASSAFFTPGTSGYRSTSSNVGLQSTFDIQPVSFSPGF